MAAAERARPAGASFDGLLAAHPELADQGYPYDSYRPETLDSLEARAAWVEPDLKPLP